MSQFACDFLLAVLKMSSTLWQKITELLFFCNDKIVDCKGLRLFNFTNIFSRVSSRCASFLYHIITDKVYKRANTLLYDHE